MKLITAILLASSFSLLSYGQALEEPDSQKALFKKKLQQYFDKHSSAANDQIMLRPKNEVTDNMPTGNFRSLMVDTDLGLAYEFTTQKIYDKESGMIYLIEKEKIYDVETNTYYDYKIH